jgi:2'-5' RNA ligase
VVWAGLDGDPDDLDGLHRLAAAVTRAVRQARVPVERRPFRPHLTLGRWRPGDTYDPGLVRDLAGYVGPCFGVDRIGLVRSHLGPSPRYESLGSWPLGDAGGVRDG